MADLSNALETVQMFEDVDTIAKYGDRWDANDYDMQSYTVQCGVIIQFKVTLESLSNTTFFPRWEKSAK